MSDNPLLQIRDHGQSVWLDDLGRSLIRSGELRRLIREDGLRGITSNPAIFHESITRGKDYDAAIAALALQDADARGIYEALAIGDVQNAADEFAGLFETSGGEQGFVSLEVDPHLADDAEGTLAEARRLWRAVARPNVMIKVPATEAGLGAIRRLVADGINVNVTLLFGIPRYRAVAEAYLAGLEDRLGAGEPLDGLRSVASFFLSRIDVLVDPQLEALMAAGGERARAAARLHGQTAVASAKLARAVFREIFEADRFARLAAAGARPQRLLWASTSTKNPAYADVKYVEPLIGPDTVNTMPRRTLDAYRDHGEPADRLDEGLKEARELMDLLPAAGVDIDRVTGQLEREGIAKFVEPFDDLAAALITARRQARERPVAAQESVLGEHAAAVEERLVAMQEERFAERLWRRDPSLWTDDEKRREAVADSLGWLDAPTTMHERITDLERFTREVRADGFERVVLLGMGGSSLAPLVLARTFGPTESGLPLTVLDTTAPETVEAAVAQARKEKTLVIVSSKSGTTTEPRDLCDLFLAEAAKSAGKGAATGDRFVAITDPGTPLEAFATEQGFRRTFLNIPDVGGRYSALTLFGLVPAALMGLDLEAILARAQLMRRACRPALPLRANPGAALGAILGELALAGRDKVTLLVPERIATLGMWLEQLLAESTGKGGKGLLPVAGEPAGPPMAYGADRVFVRFRLEGEPDNETTTRVQALAAAGHPVVTLSLGEPLDLVQEFVRWEIATATAGAVLGIDPFDQPDVQAAKDATERMLAIVREEGRLPDAEADVVDRDLRLYGAAGATDLHGALAALVEQARPGGYLAILAYLPEDDGTDDELRAMRTAVRDRFQLATTSGYGPRYLHSTGQMHKGGPATGLYLMLTADPGRAAVKVPGRKYDLGVLQLAQAIGDLQTLRDRDRRVLRVHLGGDVQGGLAEILESLRTAKTASA